jgi:hypothetical protein
VETGVNFEIADKAICDFLAGVYNVRQAISTCVGARVENAVPQSVFFKGSFAPNFAGEDSVQLGCP